MYNPHKVYHHDQNTACWLSKFEIGWTYIFISWYLQSLIIILAYLVNAVPVYTTPLVYFTSIAGWTNKHRTLNSENVKINTVASARMHGHGNGELQGSQPWQLRDFVIMHACDEHTVYWQYH